MRDPVARDQKSCVWLVFLNLRLIWIAMGEFIPFQRHDREVAQLDVPM